METQHGGDRRIKGKACELRRFRTKAEGSTQVGVKEGRHSNPNDAKHAEVELVTAGQ